MWGRRSAYVVCLADPKKRWSAPRSPSLIWYRALDHGHCSAAKTSPAFTGFCSTYSISSHNSWSERILVIERFILPERCAFDRTLLRSGADDRFISSARQTTKKGAARTAPLFFFGPRYEALEVVLHREL